MEDAVSERLHRIAAAGERVALLEAEVEDLHAYMNIASAMHETLEPERILEILLAAVTSGNALGFDRALLLLADSEGEALQGRLGVGPATAGASAHAGGSVPPSGASARGNRREASPGASSRAGRAPEEIVESVLRGLPAGRSAALTRVARQLRYPLVAGRSVVVDALLTRSALLVSDPASERRVDPLLAEHVGSSCFAVVPIIAASSPLGVVVADNVPSGRPIGPRSVGLLSALAAQAGHALERGRTFASAGRRRLRGAAIEEIAREILLSTHLERVLQTAARLAAQVFGSSRSAIWLRDADSDALRPAATHGVPANASAVFAVLEELARRAMSDRRLARSNGAAHEGGKASLLGASWAAPLTIGEEVVGALAVSGRIAHSGRPSEDPDTEDEIFLATAASLVSVAVLQARITKRAIDAEKGARESRAAMARTERLAAVGDLAVKAAREIHDPLAALGAVAAEAARALAEDDANRKRLLAVCESVERLRAPLDEAAQLAKAEEPRLKMESLETVVREATTAVADRAKARRVHLIERWGGPLPLLLLDRAKILRAVGNIVRSAVESTPQLGKIMVETRLDGEHVELTIAHEGSSAPGELAERLFAAFATREDTGGGLGFAVSAQIIREHGGELRLAAREPWAAVFSMRLPVRDNGERRRNDRRHGRDRRRAA